MAGSGILANEQIPAPLNKHTNGPKKKNKVRTKMDSLVKNESGGLARGWCRWQWQGREPAEKSMIFRIGGERFGLGFGL